jgi:hypothetical protein
VPGFTSYDDLISAISVSDQSSAFSFGKRAYTPTGSGVWYSLWLGFGVPAANRTLPASTPGQTYVNGDGGIVFPNTSPQRKFLTTFASVSNNNATTMLYDRLAAVGNIALTPSGSKTINSLALPRYADGEGVQVWLEVTTTATGSGNVTLSSYTNQAGVAGRVGYAMAWPSASNGFATLLGPLPLATGDTGVRSVQSITTASSTAGVVSLVLLRPLAYSTDRFNTWQEKDTVLQFPSIYDGATLGLASVVSAVVSTAINGQAGIAWG